MTSDLKNWLDEQGRLFLESIGIRKGDTVLDLGCGTGDYAIPAGKLVGKIGMVYAVDKESQALGELERTAHEQGVKNVVPICNQGAELEIALEQESADAALIYDVLHYMSGEEREALYGEVYGVLRPGGLLSVYPRHYKGDHPLWNLANLRLEDIVNQIEEAGFRFEGRSRQRLLHNHRYAMGEVLSFRK